MKKCWKTRAQERLNFTLLAEDIQKLLDQSTDLLQLEKYDEEAMLVLNSGSDQEIL